MDTRTHACAALFATLVLSTPLRGTAQNTSLDFGAVAPTTGTIAYATVGAALVGTNIEVDNVSGIGVGPLSQTCTGCVLSFTTGNLTATDGTSWSFGSGGSVTVSGSVPAAGATGTLMSGSFRSAQVVVLGGPFRVVSLNFVVDSVNVDLLTFFGLPASPTGAANLSFNAAATPPATFTSTTVLSGDLVTYHTCGNDAVEGTEECDGVDDAACPGLCQASCSCASPTATPTVGTPTDTPTAAPPTATPTPVPNTILDFGIIAPTTGTIDYAVVGGVLVGTNIEVDNVVALPGNSLQLCSGCTLSFTTGNLTTTSPTSWSFSGGGSITLTGNVPAAGASGTLLTGSFSNATVVSTIGTLKVFGGELVVDSINPDLLSFFGLPPSTLGNVNISFNAAGTSPATFNSTAVLSGDMVTDHRCGNGTIDGSEECDGSNDSACPGLCQSNCTCGAPPTDTPAPGTPTDTPTETPSATATPSQNHSIDFGIIAPTTGSISYTVVGGPLVGVSIQVDDVSGLPLGPVSQPCIGCVLSFTTGNFTTSGAGSWEFGGGGSFSVSGGVPAAGASGILLSGSFVSATVLAFGEPFKIFAADCLIDSVNTDLLTFYGMPVSTTAGISLSFSAAGAPPATFTSTQVLSGDLVVSHACGNDVINGIEECDGADDGSCPGECQTDCRCPAPTATPTSPPTLTATPTATFTPTATPAPICGNDTVEVGEECDGEPLCDINCTFIGCGNGIVTAGESCDDGNTLDGDGCSSTCQDTAAPESVTNPTLASGQTMTTDIEADGATVADPIETTITMGAGVASVTIEESAQQGPAVPGYSLLGEQIEITIDCPVGPCPSPSEPLMLELRIDASRIPGGVDETTLVLFRDGGLVPACTGAAGVASPDPCVDARQRFGDGDIGVRILTSQASIWTFGRAACSAAPIACSDPGKAVFQAKDPTGAPTSRKVLWKWSQGTIAGPEDFGDPLNGTSFTLCVYDGAAPVQSHVVAPGGDCDGRECWTTLGTKGFKYKNTRGNDNGITKVVLKSGTGKAKILVRGKGDALALPASDPLYAQTSSVTVQLVTSAGNCWQGIYTAPANPSTGEQFKDKFP